MSLDPRTPVLVGVGAVQQRCDDVVVAVEALELMAQAIDAAARDAGLGLRDVRWIGVPEGTWKYGDPGRLLADRHGWDDAHTVRADVGVTQQELIANACLAARDGGIAIVVGGEAKYRALQAAIGGVEAADTVDERSPDTLMGPASLGLHDVEIIHNTVVPSTTYAMIDNAIAHEAGLTPEAHRDRLGRLWGSFAAVAAENPDAWDRSGPSGATIVTPTASNRMISSPYTKLLCSQWNVDQAAALIICSVGAAQALGIAKDRWVFPHSSAVCNTSVPFPARVHAHRSPGAEVAAATLPSIDEIEIVDVYSCFPAAVQVYAATLGLSLDRQLTVTGGMTFAGGPLNNYVLQAMVRLVLLLRESPDQLGLSSSVSGVLTKQGFGTWSSRPPADGVAHQDVTASVPSLPVVDSMAGTARVVTWTVVHDKGTPATAVAVVENDDEERTIVSTAEDDVVVAMVDGDWIGRVVRAEPSGRFHVD